MENMYKNLIGTCFIFLLAFCGYIYIRPCTEKSKYLEQRIKNFRMRELTTLLSNM